jgi:hypothetical protein
MIRPFEMLPEYAQELIREVIADGRRKRKTKRVYTPEDLPTVKAMAYMKSHKRSTTMEMAAHLDRPGDHLHVMRTMAKLGNAILRTKEFNKKTHRWQTIYRLREEN